MITISDYMAYIMKELVEARRLCDGETLRMAALYANDEYLKHFPIPRFKLSEIEIAVPISVSDFDFEERITFVSSEPVFVQTVKTQLDSQIPKKQPEERSGATDLSGAYSLLSEWYAELKKCNTWDGFNTCFDTYFEKISREIRISTVPTRTGQFIEPTQPLPNLAPANLREYLKKQVKVTGKVLRKVWIEPDSNTVNRFGNEFSLMHIKAKMNEEGVVMTSVADANGKEKTLISFE